MSVAHSEQKTNTAGQSSLVASISIMHIINNWSVHHTAWDDCDCVQTKKKKVQSDIISFSYSIRSIALKEMDLIMPIRLNGWDLQKNKALRKY